MDSTPPREHTLDAAPALLREGYPFISRRCDRLGSDVFETRLLGRRTVCMRGAEAARVFYAEPITRVGGLPPLMFTLLQDKGSVATMDDRAHDVRKGMFLSLLAPERFDGLLRCVDEEWESAIDRWTRADHVVLLPATSEILTRGVCRWAGVALGEPEAIERTREFEAMISGAGAAGLRNLRGHVLRRRTERWCSELITAVREGTLAVPADSALAVVAGHRDGAELMPPAVAAVELVNFLRPTVAVARYITFLALALHQHPEAADADPRSVALEVRRYFPFFPAVGGRVRSAFGWRGYDIRAGSRILLDIYGTNRDPRSWDAPGEFRPHRFDGWEGDPYTLIPQGGGEHLHHHRCPGEWATIDLLVQAHHVFTRRLRYQVPPQDLQVALSRIPAQPASGFVVRQVQRMPSRR